MCDKEIAKFMDALTVGIARPADQVTRKNEKTIEIISEYGTTLAFVHEMEGTRESGQVKYRFRAVTDFEGIYTSKNFNLHKSSLNRFTTLGSFVVSDEACMAYFQFQLNQVNAQLALLLAANSISLLPVSIVNTARLLDGERYTLPENDSIWNLNSFVSLVEKFNKWFQIINTENGQVFAEGKDESGEEYRLTMTTNVINPATGLPGLMAQINFRYGLVNFKDRFSLINALNSMSFIYGDVPQLGAWFSEPPLDLAYQLFLPNELAGSKDIEELVLLTLMGNISYVVSGRAEAEAMSFIEASSEDLV